MPKTDLIRAAFASAAAVIERLPAYQQEVSDREDMLALLRGEDTGRDDLITAKALCYAALDGLPAERERMVRLLRDMARRDAVFIAEIACGVKIHTGRAPDLGPQINAAIERRWNQHVADVGLHDEMREGPTPH